MNKSTRKSWVTNPPKREKNINNSNFIYPAVSLLQNGYITNSKAESLRYLGCEKSLIVRFYFDLYHMVYVICMDVRTGPNFKWSGSVRRSGIPDQLKLVRKIGPDFSKISDRRSWLPWSYGYRDYMGHMILSLLYNLKHNKDCFQIKDLLIFGSMCLIILTYFQICNMLKSLICSILRAYFSNRTDHTIWFILYDNFKLYCCNC